MNTYIIHPGQSGATVTPWDDATPSARKAHRDAGAGFTIQARDETSLRRTLGKYFQEGP